MKKLFFAIFAALLLFISCKKEDKCNTDVNSVAGAYRITAVTYKASSTAPEEDYYNNFYSQPCERDDVITFSADGSYIYDDAGTLCNPPNDYTGTWALSGNVLTIDGDDVDIANFDCKKMILKINDNLTSGDEVRLTFSKL